MASSRAARRPRRPLPLPVVMVLGLAVVGLALWVLARRGGEAPLGEIDADSRARLERVLEDAEREAAR